MVSLGERGAIYTKVAPPRCLLMQQHTVERTLRRYGLVRIPRLPPRFGAHAQSRPILQEPHRLGTQSSPGRAKTLELADLIR